MGIGKNEKESESAMKRRLLRDGHRVLFPNKETSKIFDSYSIPQIRFHN